MSADRIEELEGLVDDLTAERDGLRARVEQLVEALDKIEGGEGCYTPSYGDCCDMKCAQVAREALRSVPQSTIPGRATSEEP
jgi:hypothetical protein